MKALSILFIALQLCIQPLVFAQSTTSSRCARIVENLVENDVPVPQRDFKTKKTLKKISSGKTLSEAEKIAFLDAFELQISQMQEVKAELAKIGELIEQIGFKNLARPVKKYHRTYDGLVKSLHSVGEYEKTLQSFRDNGIQFNSNTLTFNDVEFFLMATEKSILNKAGDFVKGNFFTFSPFLILPFSIATGGSLDVAFWAAVKLSAGIKGVDWGLDRILQHAPTFVSREQMVLLTAATTNLPEMGASQASALVAKDSFGDVGSTPLGSNWVNLALFGVAFGSTLKTQAVNKSIIREGQRMTMGTYWKSMRSFKYQDYKNMYGSLGHGVGWMTSAMTFQFVVRDFLRSGNPVPAGIWLSINIPLLYRYFTRGARAQKKEILDLVKKVEPNSIATTRSNLQSSFDNNIHELQNEFGKVIDEIERLKNADGRINPKTLQKQIKKLQKLIAENPDYKTQMTSFIKSIEQEDLYDLMRALKFSKKDIEEYGNDREAVINAIIWMTAGASAIFASSLVLDSAVSDLPEAIEGMDKSAAGFVVMAFLSSIGELLATRKLFLDRDAGGAAQNIADSNALNIMLAQLAMASSFISNGFEIKYSDEIEKDSNESGQSDTDSK